MNVTLTPEMDRIVTSRIEAGKGTSAAEVVLEALQMMEERDREYASDLAAFQAKMQSRFDELDCGESLESDEVIAHFAERRLKAA